MASSHQRANAPEQTAATEPHGLIDKIVTVVKHVHDEHAQREHAREEHIVEDIQHLAEHKSEAERGDLPF